MNLHGIGLHDKQFAYIANYWDGLQLFLKDGHIEIDNNTVERTIRPIALNRKNALFAGHDAGAENWATIASLIETCKLNSVDPLAYMTATLTAIVKGQEFLADIRTWDGGIRQFLIDEQCDQGKIERIMADEPKS
jgi:hypothetical protein